MFNNKKKEEEIDSDISSCEKGGKDSEWTGREVEMKGSKSLLKGKAARGERYNPSRRGDGCSYHISSFLPSLFPFPPFSPLLPIYQCPSYLCSALIIDPSDRPLFIPYAISSA